MGSDRKSKEKSRKRNYDSQSEDEVEPKRHRKDSDEQAEGSSKRDKKEKSHRSSSHKRDSKKEKKSEKQHKSKHSKHDRHSGKDKSGGNGRGDSRRPSRSTDEDGGTQSPDRTIQAQGLTPAAIEALNQMFSPTGLLTQFMEFLNSGQRNPGAATQEPHGAHSEAVESQCSNSEKIWIMPDGNTFYPYDSSIIKYIKDCVFSTWYSFWPSWDRVPMEQKDIWFNEFKKRYCWDPEHERRIRKNFEIKASARLRDAMSTSRKSGKRPQWINSEIWPRYQEYWTSDEFKALSAKGKSNRANDLENLGPLKHACGSLPASVRTRKLTENLGRETLPEEIIKETHHSKNSNKWVYKKAEKHCKLWENFRNTQSSTGGEETPSLDATLSQTKLWPEKNTDKKSRVLGYGEVSDRVKRNVRLTPGRHSSAESMGPREAAEMLSSLVAIRQQFVTLEARAKKRSSMIKSLFGYIKEHFIGSSSTAPPLDLDLSDEEEGNQQDPTHDEDHANDE